MAGNRGPRPPDLTELIRSEDRWSFVYLERCAVHRDANAITATDERGVIHIPTATLGALLLGPGTRVTYAAMCLLADSGSTAVWVGERGVRYYAHGRSLARSSRLLEAQAARVSNQRLRLDVARRMYAMRFPDEDVSGLTMQQLRGREGARVRRMYRENSDRTGVTWSRREYDPGDFGAGDAINQCLSAAHACLYGIVHSVIVALGCSPGLGFVHTGHTRSFVYDIADLYKAEVTIPVAFDVAASLSEDAAGQTRRAVRDAVQNGAILSRCARDIRALLLPGDDSVVVDAEWEADVVQLWDGATGQIAAGRNYETATE
ncbi:type I-E CRISPR-associated endonuclease Cas1 [Arthrobacter woluwensis]|uniref:type I-E CRISPR-associated endonuclease Cas1e n=1 Tax=Arthrobacter woluwensis TaxID=156980 RepID=UPI000D1200B7|nr:type I-E CRISPR-associated endonuclease Cas1e [Arthrobacter woluwensis]PSS43026.1 type I-E CRISPR-associated endonuclease Cas1 [Arthrobacter woluwensis]